MPGSCKQCPTLRSATTVAPSHSQGQTVSRKSILMYFEGLLSLGLVSLELARLLAPCQKLGPTSQWPSIRFAHPGLYSGRWCSLEIKLGQIECRNKQFTSMYSSFFLSDHQRSSPCSCSSIYRYLRYERKKHLKNFWGWNYWALFWRSFCFWRRWKIDLLTRAK